MISVVVIRTHGFLSESSTMNREMEDPGKSLRLDLDMNAKAT